jgi:hypothetical protein
LLKIMLEAAGVELLNGLKTRKLLIDDAQKL